MRYDTTRHWAYRTGSQGQSSVRLRTKACAAFGTEQTANDKPISVASMDIELVIVFCLVYGNAQSTDDSVCIIDASD